MTGENRRENARAEAERGEESLRAAEACLAASLWDDAVSRAYYAAFHFVSAQLFTVGLEAASHRGVHDLFFQHFTRPGLVSRELQRLFGALQKYREQADYSRVIRFDEQGARDEVLHARKICDALREKLVEGSWL